MIYEVLKSKINSRIKVLDPSTALINKLNNSFLVLQDNSGEFNPQDNLNFFVTAESVEFSKKVKYWLEINKKIRLVNLRSNV